MTDPHPVHHARAGARAGDRIRIAEASERQREVETYGGLDLAIENASQRITDLLAAHFGGVKRQMFTHHRIAVGTELSQRFGEPRWVALLS